MTTGKKIKWGLFLLLTGIVFLFIYYYSTFRFEYWGYQDKIWAHRVNSIEKLCQVQSKYSGIELDLVFDPGTGTFDVNHPPAPSTGLTLEHYLERLDNPEKTNIWLDFKNLSQENQAASLNRLLYLVKKFRLTLNRVIVESRYPELLYPFEQEGLKTSYYLPHNLNILSEKDLIREIDNIKEIIVLYPTTAISTDLADYEIIAAHFPEQTKYLWTLNTKFSKQFLSNYKKTRKALRDDTVEILLVRTPRMFLDL